MNRLKPAFAAVPLACALTFAPAAANTGGQRQVSVELVFLWKGLPVFRMNIDAEITARRYDVRTRSRALGVVWAFTRWTSTSRAQGRVDGPQLRPAQYLSDSKFRSRKSLISLTYPGQGQTVTRITPPKSREDWTPVPEALQQGAPDPLTAIVARLRPGGGNPCSWSGEVYDGRRRYRLSFLPDGEDTLKKSMWNRYAGPAIRCKAMTKTIAGWHKKSLAKKAKPRPPATIWFARFKGIGMWLPVKLVVHSRWGEIRGELSRFKLTPAK